MTTLLWKPLLAATLPVDADLDALPYPLYGSPKIDGYRVMGQHGQGVSRKGLVYRNAAVQRLFQGGALEGLDGELTVGDPWKADVFNRTQNCVNSGAGPAELAFEKWGQFHVFGLHSVHTAVEDIRYMLDVLHRREEFLQFKASMRLVRQTLIRDAKQLRAFEEKALAKGYEGVMLRQANGPAYPQKPGKDNRSTLNEFYLVKLKRFDFGEAVILSWFYLEHNANEEKTSTGRRSSKRSGMVIDEKRVGSVMLRNKETGETFRMTVPTNLLRDKGPRWWQQQLGATVRFKFQLCGTKDKPRIPTCEFKELL